VKGRTRETRANVERKPSLIKDKGISATSRLVVTTTSASHSLQHPLNEKPSFHPCSFRVCAPRSLTLATRSFRPTGTRPLNLVRSDSIGGKGDNIPLCVVSVFSLLRTFSTKQAISSSRAMRFRVIFSYNSNRFQKSDVCSRILKAGSNCNGNFQLNF